MTPVGRIGCALLVAAYLLAPTAATASGEPDRFEHVMALERAGRLRDALNVFATTKPLEHAAHGQALRDTVAALDASRVYERERQFAQAESLLGRLAARLDPVRDVYLVSSLNRRLAEVRSARASAESRGFARALWEDTQAVSRKVLAVLVVVLGLLLLIGVVRGSGALVRALRRRRPGVGVAVEDVSSGVDQRVRGNRALGREIAAAVAVISQRTDEDVRPELDLARDLDGSVSLNVRVVADDLEISAPYLTGGAITVGPVGFHPQELVALVGNAFSRRYEYELRGYFSASEGSARLAVELRKHNLPAVRWWSVVQGDDARLKVINETARRILFEAAASPISVSWASVAAYREARSTLAGSSLAADAGALDEARSLLERSLLHDPANVFARLELADVLRRLGANTEALAQYEFAASLSPRLTPASEVTLGIAVDYSRAVTLSKLGDWESHRQALDVLTGLVARIERSNVISRSERRRLLLLVRSAWAATKVFEAERLRGEPGERVRRRMLEVLEHVTRTRDWIAATPESALDLDRRTLVHAQAIAENAVGRAAYLVRRPQDEVTNAFARALALVPDLADAHVNMASALLRGRAGHRDWFERAQHHLSNALRISPRDRKALYLRGRLFQLSDRRDDARDAFQIAADAGDAWACLRLGEMLWGQGRKVEAIEMAKRSLASGARPDHRAKLFVLWTGALAKVGGVDSRTLHMARNVGRELTRHASKKRTTLSRDIAAALSVIEQQLRMATPAVEGG